MTILALDTSSAAVTVAVHDGSTVRAASVEYGATAHGELLAPVIARVLAAAGITAVGLSRIIVGVGPGPFTGLRIGIVTARVMGDALGIPVSGVCSLDAIAAQAVFDHAVTAEFAVATDARRKEVYLATYGVDGRRRSGPVVLRPDAVDPVARSGQVVGAGAALYPEYFDDRREPLLVSAEWLVRVALDQPEFVVDPIPLYLRRPDAVANVSRKRVTPS